MQYLIEFVIGNNLTDEQTVQSIGCYQWTFTFIFWKMQMIRNH